jgi:hypothetical protein
LIELNVIQLALGTGYTGKYETRLGLIARIYFSFLMINCHGWGDESLKYGKSFEIHE